jgi:radical SAM superfamily enzyme
MKLHLMNLVKGSTLAVTDPDYVSFPDIATYVELVVDCLEIIPPAVTIHRMTGDAPREILISPVWSFNKRTILNSINERLNLLDTWQGKKYTGI